MSAALDLGDLDAFCATLDDGAASESFVDLTEA
jgi:hypothetical protein